MAVMNNMEGYSEYYTFRDPQLAGQYNDQGQGAWYTGAFPRNGFDLPVLIFVPGLGQSACCFWDKNELYGVNQLHKMAYEAGFRTAFVSFSAPNEKAHDMWVNGKILAWQIEQICQYYRTKNVVLIAHSKGGVDAQAAITYFGAAPMVQKLITLSTPHWGSQLADLAYSSICWPLAEMLKVHSDGCYVMQTGYMREFRRLMEMNPYNTVNIETFGGNGEGPVLTRLWAGSQLLSQYGENDGVVTVHSAHNPAGSYLATLPYNHQQMMEGRFIWNNLRQAIFGLPQPAGAAPAPWAQVPFGVLLRGGLLERGIEEKFLVDSTIDKMEIYLTQAGGPAEMKASPVQILGPAGAAFDKFESKGNIEGIHIMRMVVDKPAPGKWKMKVVSGHGAYLAVVKLYGMRTFQAYPDELNDAERVGNGVGNLQTSFRILKTYPDHFEPVCDYCLGPNDTMPEVRLQEGVYNLESSVLGELSDGSPFERNIVKPLVVKAGKSVEKFISGLIKK